MIDVLAVVAHPDDAELLCAGALLRAADEGRRTAILDLTAGEGGSAGSAAVRAAEAAAAARILGLAERRNAGLADGALANAPESRLRVAALLRELRPRVVITHWPEARHPDHRVAAELAREAGFIAGLRNAPIDGEPHRPHKVIHALTYVEHGPKPTFVVDITDQMERKIDAILAFDSQLGGRRALGDVFAGGERPIREQILALHAYYGGLVRVGYGEPFFSRETVVVGDVSLLGVSSY
jgi:N-acetylglucosamine malate deacetylase 1